jgi:hypothetical protein
MSRFSQSLFSKVKRTHVLGALVNKHVAVINLAAFSVIFLFFVLYIMQVNSAVAKGFQMRELETSIHELTIENKQLEVAAREAQSLQTISSSVTMLGLVDGEMPEYIASTEPSYALAD